MPSRVMAVRFSGVPFTRINLFCKEITTERRLGSLACGFSGVPGVSPTVSTSEVQAAVRHGSTANERRSKNLANLFITCSVLCSYYLFSLLIFYILSFRLHTLYLIPHSSFLIFFRFFLAFSGSMPSALRNHSSAFFRSPSR